MSALVILATVIYSTRAYAQAPSPNVGNKPLVQGKAERTDELQTSRVGGEAGRGKATAEELSVHIPKTGHQASSRKMSRWPG